LNLSKFTRFMVVLWRLCGVKGRERSGASLL
jgi:hypothetical protein